MLYSEPTGRTFLCLSAYSLQEVYMLSVGVKMTIWRVSVFPLASYYDLNLLQNPIQERTFQDLVIGLAASDGIAKQRSGAFVMNR